MKINRIFQNETSSPIMSPINKMVDTNAFGQVNLHLAFFTFPNRILDSRSMCLSFDFLFGG